MTSIAASVGRNGENRPEDVRIVQEMLASAPPDVLPARLTDLIASIEEFQRRALRIARPTGRIDPSSPTFLALARLSGAAVLAPAA